MSTHIQPAKSRILCTSSPLFPINRPTLSLGSSHAMVYSVSRVPTQIQICTSVNAGRWWSLVTNSYKFILMTQWLMVVSCKWGSMMIMKDQHLTGLNSQLTQHMSPPQVLLITGIDLLTCEYIWQTSVLSDQPCTQRNSLNLEGSWQLSRRAHRAMLSLHHPCLLCLSSLDPPGWTKVEQHVNLLFLWDHVRYLLKGMQPSHLLHFHRAMLPASCWKHGSDIFWLHLKKKGSAEYKISNKGSWPDSSISNIVKRKEKTPSHFASATLPGCKDEGGGMAARRAGPGGHSLVRFDLGRFLGRHIKLTNRIWCSLMPGSWNKSTFI